MKKQIVVTLFILTVPFFLFAQNKTDLEKEKATIKEVIIKAYLGGIANRGDVDALRQGFHPGFTMFGVEENSLWKRPLYTWIEMIEKSKEEGKYPPKEKVTFEFPMIDITGRAAVVKIKFVRGGKLAYTDYLSLYKFDDGWKIVAKIFHSHKK